MKKSEYLERRKSHWLKYFRDPESECSEDHGPAAQRAIMDAHAAEAAGVVWEPEEEPLPQKLLTCNAICDNRGVLRPHLFPAESTPWEWIREEHKSEEIAIYVEAVRRYNAWPMLEKVLRAMVTGDWSEGRPLDLLAAILRGGPR